MRSSTFYASWGEFAVDAGMTKSLASKALGLVFCFLGFYLNRDIKEGRFLKY